MAGCRVRPPAPPTPRRWPRRTVVGVLVAAVAAWASLNTYAATKIARGGVDTRQVPNPASVGLAFAKSSTATGCRPGTYPVRPADPLS